MVAPFRPAVEVWLESDGNVAALRERAAAALNADAGVGRPCAGLRWLGAQLRDPGATGKTRRMLRELATELLLVQIEEQRNSGMSFRGQHAALSLLQPFAAERLLELLLQTPDWFADTRRAHLVPAIADLQVDAPSPPILLGTLDLIEATDTEPEDLRYALSWLVWQWGRKEYVEKRAASLRAASAEGDAEDRILALRSLGDLWYRVQDYGRAAATHRALAQMATANHFELLPNDWYWGACYASLGGRVDDGIAALGRCADRLASPALDSSHRLPRKLFEQDPEIARLRADPRFAAILAHAFGPAETTAKDH